MTFQAIFDQDAISYLPKTKKYINELSDKKRICHHNYCVIQKIGNHHKALTEMTSEEIEYFDKKTLSYLNNIDSAI